MAGWLEALGDILFDILNNQGREDFLARLGSARTSTGASAGGGVCFVGGYINHRVRKLARAARMEGLEVHLITWSGKALEPDAAADFARVSHFYNLLELFRALGAIADGPVHTFVTGHQGFVAALCALVARRENIIVDIYDLMHPDRGDLPQVRDGTPTHRSLETASYFHRFLVNHAPAICSRVTVGRPLRTTFDGARSAQRRLYLAEFTGGALIPAKPKLSDADGKLHLVMGGTYLGESAMGCKWPSIEFLAGAASALDLHFHLYGTPLGDTGTFIPSRFVDYLAAGVFVLVP